MVEQRRTTGIGVESLQWFFAGMSSNFDDYLSPQSVTDFEEFETKKYLMEKIPTSVPVEGDEDMLI